MKSSNHKITKVLIANRGEIALRIDRACRSLGIQTTFVCSEADRNSFFARQAKELVIVGPAAAKDSYLNIPRLLAAAKENNCNAVHPGYGFLSENSGFAKQVREAGLIFIGPSPESIEALGSKTEARRRVQERGVPTTAGTPGDLSDEALIAAAQAIGFPVIIKAVAGGGGRGMRVVNNVREMEEALPRARAEALKNFSNEAVYCEQYIHEPRHVEVQIFGDQFGNVIHFGTRDCSTQRRHQKLVEEAPAPFLRDEMRKRIEQAAVEAARSVNYYNAGTAEFLVKGDKFYFLEMNTRIQVEHPVTEMVTGADLVQLQLKIAQGEALPMQQKDIKFRGHAIEFRIYAEDPANNFSPSKGQITKLRRPQAQYIREDGSIEEHDEIVLFYDAMLSKLIVHGKNRDDAVAKSYQALRDYTLEGVATTLPFHRWLLRVSPFRSSPLDIGYLSREFSHESLRALDASEVVDPAHSEPEHGAAKVERFEYHSQRFDTLYTVELTHREAGLFLAVPTLSSERRPAPRFCRISNGKNAAIGALISEVLEKVDPDEIFA